VQRTRLLQILGFVIVPMLSIASPLLAIPAITSRYGAAGWSAVAIGQSVGASLAVIVELGWGLTGPQRVARQSRKARQQTLAISLTTKLLVLVPLVVIAACASFLLSPSFRLEAAAVAVGATAYGLNSTWYFIGTGSSIKLLLSDAVPRLLCVAASAFLVFAGGALLVYPAVGVILPIVVSTVSVIHIERVSTRQLHGLNMRRLVKTVAAQGTALGGRALSAVYMSLPITLVSLVAPPAVPIFSAIERLQRIYLQVLAAAPNVMQKWVGQSKGLRRKYRRAAKSVTYNAALGLLAGAGFTLVAPVMSTIVFAASIQIPMEYAAISGVLIFIVCTSRASGSIALVAVGQVRAILISAAVGALVGVPSILVAARMFGVPGALIGEVLAEVIVLLIQLRALRKHSAPPR